MRCNVIGQHQNIGIFKTIPAKTRLRNVKPCQNYPNWYSANVGDVEIFVWGGFLLDNVLLVDYNPTELDVNVGDLVEVLGIYGDWVWAKILTPTHHTSMPTNTMGWLPCVILSGGYFDDKYIPIMPMTTKYIR
ncbi:hypothetical protein [Moraxella sp.]|uniref:hypothetical protein n=1 Tax=Moraxella sp. TaxID=479 RepID=UPI0026DBE9ED|nr:hypothetical protein [Moraxella sp.]MDO4893906.1 hypothetical protein [Moraxella sp.]